MPVVKTGIRNQSHSQEIPGFRTRIKNQGQSQYMLKSGDKAKGKIHQESNVKTRDLISEAKKFTQVRSKYLSLCPDKVLYRITNCP